MERRTKKPPSRLRQLKIELLRRSFIPDNLLPGTHYPDPFRLWPPTCHCTDPKDPGHVVRALSFMSAGKHRIERIATSRLVAPLVCAPDASFKTVREVLTANTELLILVGTQKPKRL
jgi:hypothetical protein